MTTIDDSGKKLVAMWSGPRNISTAMMRAWENRNDTEVLDEPFYAHYLQHTALDHPMAAAVIESQETDWQKISNTISNANNSKNQIQYQKHITTHMLAHIDLKWTLALNNCFLIRAPEPVVASYGNKRETVTAIDLGYQEQVRVFEFVRSHTNQTPIVIDSQRFLKKPKAHLAMVCHRLDIPFSDKMLNWPAGKRSSDGVWAAHWYDAVEKSIGFKPWQDQQLTLDQTQKNIAGQCRPAYEKMLEIALDP